MNSPQQKQKANQRLAIALVLCSLLAPLLLVSSAAGLDTASLDALLEDMGLTKSERDVTAPEFTLSEPSGNKVRLADLRGKVVFLTFWGTW